VLLETLRVDYPAISFVSGSRFAWHPNQREVVYVARKMRAQDDWSLLHELGHALQEHRDFESDMQLLHMEVDAWQKATEIGKQYGVEIDQDHVQDCLDSYRDWLHARATCPTCLERCLQKDTRTYHCHNCQTEWQVTKSRLCRAYRRTNQKNRI